MSEQLELPAAVPLDSPEVKQPEAAPAWLLEGLVRDLPAELYHAHEAFSSGGAKKLYQAPALYLEERTHPKEPTEAMRLGTALHTLILEPDLASSIVKAPKFDRRYKEGKAAAEAFDTENAGKLILTPEQYGAAFGMLASVYRHPAASKLLDGGESEVSMFWKHPTYGFPCKLRLDKANRGGIVDVKTCADASPEGFARAVGTYLYHAQAAHYWDGAELVTGEPVKFFAFVAVENTPPYLVATYVLPPEAIALGAAIIAIAAERYHKARESGIWPGYAPTIETLRMPGWAMKLNT